MTRRSRRSVRGNEEALRAHVSRLAHDLAHPIQNIGNCCKLAVRFWGDQQYRETFRIDIQRELARLTELFGEIRRAGHADRGCDGGDKGSTANRAHRLRAVTRHPKERDVRKGRRSRGAF